MSELSEVTATVVSSQSVTADIIDAETVSVGILELDTLTVTNLTANNVTVAKECQIANPLNVDFYGDVLSVTSNVFLGCEVPPVNTHSLNVVIGPNSGSQLTTGSGNVFVGDNVAQNVTTEYHNIAIGKNALTSLSATPGSVGVENICIGSNSGAQVLGNNNIAIGSSALQNGGNSNIVIGTSAAGQTETVGNNNIAIGTRVCNNVSIGNNNILLGYQAAVGAPSVNNSIALGTNCIANSDDTIYIGNQTVAPFYTNIVLGKASGAGAASTIIPGPYINDAAASGAGVSTGQLYYRQDGLPGAERSVLCICLV